MKSKKRKELTPLEQIKRERELLRRECVTSEARLAEQWSYLSDNIGTLVFNSAANSVRHRLGFGSSKKASVETDIYDNLNDSLLSSMSLGQKIMNGIMVSAPVLWEVLQPMLMNLAMDKIKSIFKRNPSKKDKDQEE